MNSTDFIEEIQQHFNRALPFVVYRKPNRLEVYAMLQKDEKLHIIQDYTESGFVFSPFDAKEQAVLIPSNSSEVLKTDDVISFTTEASSIHKNTSEKNKEAHVQLVQKGIDAIKNKDLQKVVLSRCETQELTEENPLKIFKNLLQKYATAFVYCWYHPQVGLWLGATPETLLKVQGNRFSTMALAGTQIYSGTEDVVWQNKEKEEQQIVTDFVVNSLSFAVKSINVSQVETVRAGSLLHLKTAISGTLNKELFSFKQLLSSLHPTPAVCGFPKESAKQFIIKNENYKRGFYAGFLGELNIKETKSRNTNRRNVENNAYASIKTVSNLYVNLRCMQLTNKQALIYVGGGITKDSIAENEWEETVNKTQTIKAVL
ncbi:chorismate-binding protein [Lacinutrix sp. C3R15]|uniref:chorismate-binding protein n=1 Tax=Flavobacteriaceae TaxID=49546 RepID=UPI001C08734D|nr:MULTISPECIES: chorismate-binding protein [Flavobacteriaceae]MBU2940494.1 chorismate-binding protein [Lacinutrix sp. C3R15]MDO6623814.1 chorismate-binding protein [Oceanihabitans sp. 1_MG-2023]